MEHVKFQVVWCFSLWPRMSFNKWIKVRSVKERFAGVHPPYVVARGSKLLDAAFQNCGFSDMKKTCAGSRGKIVKWRFSAPGFPLEVSLYLLASEAAQVHVIKWLCAIQGWHWSYARVVSRVKLYKWRLSSGCLQFKVHIWGVKVIKWTSSVPVLAVEVCKYLLATRDVQVTVFKWIYSAQCLAVEARKYRLASEVVQVKVVNSCAEALRQNVQPDSGMNDMQRKKCKYWIQMLLSTSVCETGSYDIFYWAKEVCNQQTKICEHCSVALSCNIQV